MHNSHFIDASEHENDEHPAPNETSPLLLPAYSHEQPEPASPQPLNADAYSYPPKFEITGPYLDHLRFELICSPHILDPRSPIRPFISLETKTAAFIEQTRVIQIEFSKGHSTLTLHGAECKGESLTDPVDWAWFCQFIRRLQTIYATPKSKLETFIPTRIDFAIHISPPIDLEKTEFKHSKTTPRTEWRTGSGTLNGLWIGRRDAHSILLRAYQKDLDPSKQSSYVRFGTTNFTRFEWEVPSYVLREIAPPIQIKPEDWNLTTIFQHCLSNKRPILYNLIEAKKIKSRHNEQGDYNYAYETARSLAAGHLSFDQLTDLHAEITTLLEQRKPTSNDTENIDKPHMQ